MLLSPFEVRVAQHNPIGIQHVRILQTPDPKNPDEQNVRNFEVNGGAVSSAWSDIVHSNFFLDHATARFNYVTPNGQNVKFSGGVTHFGTGTNWKDHTYGGSISLKGNEWGPLFPDIGLNANYTPAGNDFMTTLRVQFRW